MFIKHFNIIFVHRNTLKHLFCTISRYFANFAAEKIKYANEIILFIIIFMRIGADCPRTN